MISSYTDLTDAQKGYFETSFREEDLDFEACSKLYFDMEDLLDLEKHSAEVGFQKLSQFLDNLVYLTSRVTTHGHYQMTESDIKLRRAYREIFDQTARTFGEERAIDQLGAHPLFVEAGPVANPQRPSRFHQKQVSSAGPFEA